LLALLWSDIDFESDILSVSKSLEETKAGLRVKSTKSGKPRKFSVPVQALEALKEHRQEQDRDRELFGADYEDNDLIFCRPQGGYYKTDKVSVRGTELAKKAGLRGVGLHSLRHSHASELLSKARRFRRLRSVWGTQMRTSRFRSIVTRWKLMNLPPRRFGTMPWRT
jgi:integrase